MEFTFDIGLWGLLALAAGAVLIGLIAQAIGEVRTGYEWLATAVGAFIGGLVASELVVAWKTFEPVWEGLAIVPAIVGALVVGIIVDAVVRYTTHGSYTHHGVAA